MSQTEGTTVQGIVIKESQIPYDELKKHDYSSNSENGVNNNIKLFNQISSEEFIQLIGYDNDISYENLIYAVNKLSELSIECASINISNNTIIEGMDAINYKAFDLIDIYGNNYLFILRKNDNEFIVLLNSNNKLIEGILDNSLLPQYFSDFIYD